MPPNTTAKGIFDKLAEVHYDASTLNKQQTLTRFYSYKTGVKQSPVQAFTEIQDLARSLNDMGIKMEEIAVVIEIVTSLPEGKYQAFKAAWDSVEKNSQTMSRLLARLKKLELGEKTDGDAEPEVVRAFHSKKAFPKNLRRGVHFAYTCLRRYKMWRLACRNAYMC